MNTTVNRGARLEPSAGAGVRLVAEREITTRLKSKAFIISTAIVLGLVLALVLIAGFVEKSGGFGGETRVATVGVAAEAVAPLDGHGFELVPADNEAAAEGMVAGGKVEAAVVPGGDSPVGVTVIAQSEAPLDLVQALSVPPTVELLDASGESTAMAYIIALAFGAIFMMSALTFGTTIAQSVVEEKQTRIVEILLATVSPRVLLAGKIMGNSILAIAQVVLIAAVASVGMLATGQDLLLGELGTSMIWFAVLFAVGFVLLASLYAALASLVSRQEDIGAVTSPLMILIMLPYMGVIFFYDNPEALTAMSYFPFTSPVAMPMRLYLGTAQWWEPILALVILLVTIVAAVAVGTRIYENSILRIGARVKLSEAIARS